MSKIKKDFDVSCPFDLSFLKNIVFIKIRLALPLKLILNLNFEDALFLSLYFETFVIVKDGIAMPGWSMFKTTPLVEYDTSNITIFKKTLNITQDEWNDIHFYFNLSKSQLAKW